MRNFVTHKNRNETNQVDVTAENLEGVRKCLVATGYELLEVQDFEDGGANETWECAVTSKLVRLCSSQEVEEPEASRRELVNEVIDLWVELRAIRNTLSLALRDDNDLDLPKPEETPLDRLRSATEELETAKEENPGQWEYLFKTDSSVLAYVALDESDRAAVTH